MDIKTAFDELVKNGMSPEEAIQQLKSEIENLLQGGQIDDAMAQQMLSEIEGLANGGQPAEENPPMMEEEDGLTEEQPMEEEPAMNAENAQPMEGSEEEPLPTEEEVPQEQPMMEEETQPQDAPPMDNNSEMAEDEFAIRAEELMESGEFENFDEAYDFAMDESSMEQNDGSMVQTMVTQFLNGEIDENQVLEMLRKLKQGMSGPATPTPPEKNY